MWTRRRLSKCPTNELPKLCLERNLGQIVTDNDNVPHDILITQPGDYVLTVIEDGGPADFPFFVGDLLSPSGTKDYLDKACFLKVPISFGEVGINNGANDQNRSLSTCRPPYVVVKDNRIRLDNVLRDLEYEFKVTLEKGLEVSHVLSEQECLCRDGIESFWSSLYVDDVNIWGHVWVDPNDDDLGILYLKSNSIYQGELPLADQKAYLEDVDFFTRVKDNALDSEQALMVMLKNLLMPYPHGGFDTPVFCDIDPAVAADAYFITPAGVPATISSATTSLAFASTNGIDDILSNSVVAYTDAVSTYRSYTVDSHNSGLSAGYYNDITGEFVEALDVVFGSQQIDIVAALESCTGGCLMDLSTNIQATKMGTEDLSDGGFDVKVKASLKENLHDNDNYSFTFDDHLEVVESVLCAIRNGTDNVTYPSHLDGKIVRVHDIEFQGHTYPTMAISLPLNGNGTLTLLKPTVRDIAWGYNGIAGFYGSIRIGVEDDARLQVFGKETGQSWWFSRTFWDNNFNNHFGCDHNPLSTERLHDDLIIDGNEDKNLLIFVNGYRPTVPTNLKDDYERKSGFSNCFDNYTETGPYWGAIQTQFIKRIGTKNVVFIDGHNDITTSNHNKNNDIQDSKLNFAHNGIRSVLRHPGVTAPDIVID